MGQAVAQLVETDPGAKIVCGVDTHNSIANAPADADVIVDFSHPSALPSLLAFGKAHKIPLVLATTGYSVRDTETIRQASNSVPILHSATMSLGINILLNLAGQVAKILSDGFDVEIIEKHHNKKVDAPSGVALTIADTISNALPFPGEYVYDRHSTRKPRGQHEIGISSIRGGTIVGDHSVIFAGNDEILEITHHAAGREIFAAGALHAAKFLAGKPCGLYSMQDAIKLPMPRD
jgi:4-hydroxy-tetrahydrodipicolinate reductase